VLDGGIGNKNWKLAGLHKIGQQQSVFPPLRDRIKQTFLRLHSASSNGESGRVQVPNATVWLEHLFLKSSKPQFFRTANCPRAISDEVELKATVPR
jgi:hypothetical protein